MPGQAAHRPSSTRSGALDTDRIGRRPSDQTTIGGSPRRIVRIRRTSQSEHSCPASAMASRNRPRPIDRPAPAASRSKIGLATSIRDSSLVCPWSARRTFSASSPTRLAAFLAAFAAVRARRSLLCALVSR
jgi:hypothetical protein